MSHLKINVKHFSVAFFSMTMLTLTACHSNTDKEQGSANSKADTTSTTTPAATPEAPVVIAADDSLTAGVKDALKDYPNVKATTSNGEITLSGDVERSRLSGLMMSLNSLHPKKINNNLTVK